jgi:branched-chain amino acid transport system substrate-binding protein
MRDLFLSILILLGTIKCGAGAPDVSSEIILGMSTVLSGPAADLGKDMREGVEAGLARANRAGGANGHPLRLIALDDGYEPARTAPNLRQLLEKDKVLAVIGDVGTPTAIAALPIALEQKTLFFAPFTGAGLLRKNPPDRYVINFRASYAEETASMIDALIDGAGLQPRDIAFFTQRDGYGDAGFTGGIAALQRHGLQNANQVPHVRYERNTLAVENALATLLYAEHTPSAIIMVGAYGPCAKFIKLAHEAGLRALFLNVSFVGSNSLATELGKLPVPVIVTQVVPYPLDRSVPVVREYLADLQAFDPAAKPGFGTLEGYIDARVLEAALDKNPCQPTRESVIDALEGLGTFDLGLGEKLELGRHQHQASHRVWPTILQDGAFVPFAWTDLAKLLTGAGQP